MSKTLDFCLIYNSDNVPVVIDEKGLGIVASLVPEMTGLTYEDFAEACVALGDRFERHTIVLRDQRASQKSDIDAACLVPDLGIGFKHDANKAPAARWAVLVEATTLPYPITVEGYGLMPFALSEYIHTKILEYLYPSVIGDPDFFAVFAARLRPSGEKASSDAETVTFTPE